MINIDQIFSLRHTSYCPHLWVGYQVDIVFIWEKTDWDFTALEGVALGSQ